MVTKHSSALLSFVTTAILIPTFKPVCFHRRVCPLTPRCRGRGGRREGRVEADSQGTTSSVYTLDSQAHPLDYPGLCNYRAHGSGLNNGGH